MKSSMKTIAAALVLGLGAYSAAPVPAQDAPKAPATGTMAPMAGDKGMAAPAKAPEKEMAKPDAPKSMEVTGEIIDMACYAAEGEHGEAHKACAADCLAKGSPMGLLTTDGKVYLISNHGDDALVKTLRGKAAETVKLTGDVANRGGMLTLNAKSMAGDTAKPMDKMMDKGMSDMKMGDMKMGADKAMDKGAEKAAPPATK